MKLLTMATGEQSVRLTLYKENISGLYMIVQRPWSGQIQLQLHDIRQELDDILQYVCIYSISYVYIYVMYICD
jgi:hypothetical protein